MSGDKSPDSRKALENKVADQLNLDVYQLRKAQFSEEKLQTIFNKAQSNQENGEIANLACTIAYAGGVLGLMSTLAINDSDAQWTMIGFSLTAMLSAFGISTAPNKNFKKTIEQEVETAISNQRPSPPKP